MTGRQQLLAYIVAGWLTWYLLSCWLWPFRRCSVCRGRGRHAREDGQVFRPCWWCKGSGARLRYGRRAWNLWRHSG